MAALVVPHKSFPVSLLSSFVSCFVSSLFSLLSSLSNVIAYKCELSLLAVCLFSSPLFSSPPSLHAYFQPPGLLYHLDIYVSCRIALHCVALHCLFFCCLIASIGAIIIKSWLLHISRSVSQSVSQSVYLSVY